MSADRERAAMRLDEAHDDVGSARRPAVALLEHPVRLAHAGCHAQVEPQPATTAARLRPVPLEQLVGRRALVERVALGGRSSEQPVEVKVQLEHMHPRLAQEPEQRPVGVARDRGLDRRPGQRPAPRPRAPPGTRRPRG